MPKYENTSKVPLKILTPTGIKTVAPAQIVELTSGIASRGKPYLKEVKEVAQEPQLLVEAPLPIEEKEVVSEEKPVEEETLKIDVDGDGEPDLEIKGEIVESSETSEEEAVEEKPSSKKRKRRN